MPEAISTSWPGTEKRPLRPARPSMRWSTTTGCFRPSRSSRSRSSITSTTAPRPTAATRSYPIRASNRTIRTTILRTATCAGMVSAPRRASTSPTPTCSLHDQPNATSIQQAWVAHFVSKYGPGVIGRRADLRTRQRTERLDRGSPRRPAAEHRLQRSRQPLDRECEGDQGRGPEAPSSSVRETSPRPTRTVTAAANPVPVPLIQRPNTAARLSACTIFSSSPRKARACSIIIPCTIRGVAASRPTGRFPIW